MPLNAATGLQEPLETDEFVGKSDQCRSDGHAVATEICGLTETDNGNEAFAQKGKILYVFVVRLRLHDTGRTLKFAAKIECRITINCKFCKL